MHVTCGDFSGELEFLQQTLLFGHKKVLFRHYNFKVYCCVIIVFFVFLQPKEVSYENKNLFNAPLDDIRT